MSAVYTAASATVVLDGSIQKCDYKLSLETRLIAISLSKWQERLWTLQESSLSRNLLFMFKDDLVSAEAFIATEYNQKLYRPVVRNTGILLVNLSDWNRADKISVGRVQRNLCRRTSSKPDDEALAVAPLFPHVDIFSVLDVEGEERMIQFWKEVKNLPRGIIAMGVPRIPRDGYRWAPRSLMNQGDAVGQDLQDKNATVTELGLKAQYWVCKLHASDLPKIPQIELSFLEADSSCLLRLSATNNYPEITLSAAGNAVVLLEKLAPGMDHYTGVLLSIISNGPYRHTQQLPVYRYEGVVGVNIMSKETLRFTQADTVWDQMRRMTKGTYSSRWAEIYIR